MHSVQRLPTFCHRVLEVVLLEEQRIGGGFMEWVIMVEQLRTNHTSPSAMRSVDCCVKHGATGLERRDTRSLG